MPDTVHHSDLDLSPQLRQIRLVAQVKLPVGVLHSTGAVFTKD